MSQKRPTDEQPWEPTIEKMPTFNPFSNAQNPSKDFEPTANDEDLEDDSGEETKPLKP
jgi:hypothetical protein